MIVLYLLDANVLITANNQYYPVNAVPQFWDWLVQRAIAGEIKMPLETLEEVKDGGADDPLFAWIQDAAVKKAILFDGDPAEPSLVQQVLAAYAPDLTDDEIEQIGRDPFLIAYGLASPADRYVVTTEASKPRQKRQNRRIPDVCADLGVQCCNTFDMLRALNFAIK